MARRQVTVYVPGEPIDSLQIAWALRRRSVSGYVAVSLGAARKYIGKRAGVA